MKKSIFGLVVLVAGQVSAECIIDPELMNKDVWAEPYFASQEEAARGLASEAVQNHEAVMEPDQYLDVVKKIPSSEPTITRAWMEYKFLKDEE